MLDTSRPTLAQSPILHDLTRGLIVWPGEDLWHPQRRQTLAFFNKRIELHQLLECRAILR